MAPHQDLTASHTSSLERSLLTNSLLGSLAPSQQVKESIPRPLQQVVGWSVRVGENSGLRFGGRVRNGQGYEFISVMVI